MKITHIDQFFPRRRMRLVRIETDSGLVGWGETTLEGKPKSTVAAVEELAEYLIGKDPLRIEHHWQHIYRSAFFRGGNVLMSALSGIDQALWDIAGKHFGVPAYQLLGGAVRDRIRVYAHWGIGSLTDEGKTRAKERLDMLRKKGGYTAFKAGPGGKSLQFFEVFLRDVLLLYFDDRLDRLPRLDLQPRRDLFARQDAVAVL